MASKTAESYIELFEIINVKNKSIALGTTLDPITVMLDFEKAMMNVIVRFSGEEVRGTIIGIWRIVKFAHELWMPDLGTDM